MEFEKLALEVGAIRAGLTPVSPNVQQGNSGVEHRFNLLFTDGSRNYAFDFYETVSDLDVVKSYAKKFDTKTSVSIVCTGGQVTERARSLAASYGMKILNPDETESFFSLQRPTPRRIFG